LMDAIGETESVHTSGYTWVHPRVAQSSV
jgi:hypothetical protein